VLRYLLDEIGAEKLETVVWEANRDGLRLAHAHGFLEEVDRYLAFADTPPFLTLWRALTFVGGI